MKGKSGKSGHKPATPGGKKTPQGGMSSPPVQMTNVMPKGLPKGNRSNN